MPRYIAKDQHGPASTTWTSEPDRMRGSRREANKTSRRALRWSGLRRLGPKEKVTVTVTYRGGNAAWYLLEARGRSGVFSGVVALHDAMREIRADR